MRNISSSLRDVFALRKDPFVDLYELSECTGERTCFDRFFFDCGERQGLRAAVAFLALLGVTWVFGAVAVGGAAVVFVYLFVICNVLQGAAIFLFQCYLDQSFG